MEIQKKACPERSRRGFTLVELMVALFILAVILIMGAAATNYTVGKLRSKKTIDINTPVRNAFDIITQKMNTANAKITSITPPVYGFNVSGGILEIVSSSSSGTTCTTIGKVIVGSVGVLKMKQTDNSCDTVISNTWQAITPSTIDVTVFTPTITNPMIDSNPTAIPFVQLEIIAQDPVDPNNKIDLQTSYYLDYQTVNNLK